VLSTVGGAAAYWAWLGAGWAGAVHVPLNPDLRARLLISAVRTTGARLAVVEERHLEHLLAVAGEIPLEHLLVLDGDGTDRGRLAGSAHPGRRPAPGSRGPQPPAGAGPVVDRRRYLHVGHDRGIKVRPPDMGGN
jgi:hypothetical protein